MVGWRVSGWLDQLELELMQHQPNLGWDWAELGKILGGEIFGHRNFGSRKKLGPKQMWSPQQFWVQKNLGPKRKLVQKNLDQKQIRLKKIWGEKKIGPEGGGSKVWDEVH